MLRRLIGELCNRELRSWIDTITNPTSTIVRDLQVGHGRVQDIHFVVKFYYFY